MRLLDPPYAVGGDTRLELAGVGYFLPADFTGDAFPHVIAGSGSLLFASAIQVAGFNSFMLVMDATGTTPTLTLRYRIVDPIDGTTNLATRQIIAGAAGGAGLVFTFGAFGQSSTVTQGDVFHTIRLEILNDTANTLTIATPRLWCGKR